MAKDFDYWMNYKDWVYHMALRNPGKTGQGYCDRHTDTPHDAVLSKYGWRYNHTTIIGAYEGRGGDYAIHTYKYDMTEWVVSVVCRPGWRCEAHSLGSGRRTTIGYHIERYLKDKTRKLKRQIEMNQRACRPGG